MTTYESKLRAKVGEEPLFVPRIFAIITDETGRILLQVGAAGTVGQLPHWPMAVGERFSDTLARGLKDSLGVTEADYRLGRLLDVISQPNVKMPQGMVQYLDFCYLVKATGRVPAAELALDFTWLELDKFNEALVGFDSQLPFLYRYLQEQHKED